MKRTNSLIKGKVILPLAIIFSLISCKKNGPGDLSPTGILELELGLKMSIEAASSKLKSSDVNEFLVIVYQQSGEEVASYSRAADMPSEVPLQPGNYYVVANSNDLQPAAFESTYYEGTSDVFTIDAGQSTSVGITCELANMMVTVSYSDNVSTQFDSYSTVVGGATGSLTFSETEDRAGYFEVMPLHIEATLEYEDNEGVTQTKTIEGDITDPEPKKHYEIIIDASLDIGQGAITLAVDETVETETITLTEGSEIEVTPLEAGDLIISEIMANPTILDDNLGEWFEVYNISSEGKSLQDAVIRRGTGTHTISDEVILAPGEYAVLAVSDQAVSQADYIYSSITLTNGGSLLELVYDDGTGEVVIAAVDYTTDNDFPGVVAGSAMQLDVNSFSNATNGRNWCTSENLFNASEYGTPGTANLSCPAP